MFPKVPLLLLGFIALGLRVCSFEYEDISKLWPDFTMCVEYAVFRYNQAQSDIFAYKLLWVHRSQRKQFTWTYLMDLEMGRTICKKHDEDIDNCRLQGGPEKKVVRCTFVVNVIPMTSEFTLLNSTCL
ncbi:probable cystatin-15 [Erinaceus europaeus]|uniref:Probable cystatin-15 n=1 Tax=Erinaceus europaeus TaxID=9365 RepID=A0ABM3X0C3_ERIEU|nr:probable cystatin-15 [Erinaceus europaeus]XP_060042274.1 probable cystatin-15 [Erinaceus europaeus]